MNKEYKDYLKTSDWKERRKELLEEAGNECNVCGASANILHHLNYDNLGFEELETDVVAVCNSCHMELHEGGQEGYGEW